MNKEENSEYTDERTSNEKEPARKNVKIFLPKQAAEKLGLAVSTLSKMRVRGDGPIYLKMGRSVRYLEEDIENYIESCRRSNTILE